MSLLEDRLAASQRVKLPCSHVSLGGKSTSSMKPVLVQWPNLNFLEFNFENFYGTNSQPEASIIVKSDTVTGKLGEQHPSISHFSPASVKSD